MGEAAWRESHLDLKILAAITRPIANNAQPMMKLVPKPLMVSRELTLKSKITTSACAVVVNTGDPNAISMARYDFMELNVGKWWFFLAATLDVEAPAGI